MGVTVGVGVRVGVSVCVGAGVSEGAGTAEVAVSRAWSNRAVSAACISGVLVGRGAHAIIEVVNMQHNKIWGNICSEKRIRYFTSLKSDYIISWFLPLSTGLSGCRML